MAKNPGFDGKIEIDESQSGSFIELTNVSSLDFEPMRALLDASDFADEGEARIGGRTDFTATATLYTDFANETSHTDILDAILNDTLVDVKITPDRNGTFNFTATCRVSTVGGSIAGGSTQSATVEFSNADGNKWAYSTS
jgi:hypothetical protein